MAVVVPEGRTRQGRVRYSHVTYHQLDEDSDRIALGLAECGVEPADRAAVMVRPGLDFFALAFGLFKAGVVPVLIDPGMGSRAWGVPGRGRARGFHRNHQGGLGQAGARLGKALRAPGRPRRAAVLLERSDDFGRRSPAGATSRGRGPIRRFHPSIDRPGRHRRHPVHQRQHGSTQGGRLHPRDLPAPRSSIFRDALRDRAGRDRSLHVPLFALFAPALGMTAIVPEMDPTRPAQVDPAKLVRGDRRLRRRRTCSARRPCSAGSAACARPRRDELPTLKRVVSAGAPCLGASARPSSHGCSSPRRRSSRPTAPPRRCRSPRSAATRSWARPATDRRGALASASAGRSRASRCEIIRDQRRADPALVRRPWRARRARSARSSSRARSSPASTSAAPRPTALAKIADPAGRSFYHRMGDLGYRDDRGRHLVLRPEVAPGRSSPTRPSSPSAARASSTPTPRSPAPRWWASGRPRGRSPSSASSPSRRLTAAEAERVRARAARARVRPGHIPRPIRDDPVPPVVPGRYPPQRQDLPREAGGLGREEAAMTDWSNGPVLVTGGGGFLGIGDRPAA